MADATIEWRGLIELQRGMAAAEQSLPAQLHDAMQDSLNLVKGDAERTLGGHGLKRLAGSLATDISGSGTALVGTVSTDRPSAFWVEHGRAAGRRPPPSHALRQWAGEHGIPTDAGTLFVIARAIGRRGIRPRPFLRPALERNTGRIQQVFAKMGAAVVARMARG